MSSSGPPRRFAPIPVEQSTKSSQQASPPKDESAKPRRFAPIPVETSSKSSRQASPPPQNEAPRPRRFAPIPVETSTKSPQQASPPKDENSKPRRFAPVPVETSAKSSRQPLPLKDETPKPRRFAPVAIETSTTSSRDVKPELKEDAKPSPRRFAPQVIEQTQSHSASAKDSDSKPHIRFKPEPISTTHRSNRSSQSSDGETSSPTILVDQPAKKPPRKFAVELIDTAKRSRRADTDESQSSTEKMEDGFAIAANERRKLRNSNGGGDEDSPASSTSLATGGELRRQLFATNDRPRHSPRAHSFRMPDLDTIESSESEPEDSAPTSPMDGPSRVDSPYASSDASYAVFKHATRVRESFDEGYTHYLLEIEQKNALKRFEEQALAAYPNLDLNYEPPHHYANHDNSGSDYTDVEDRPVTFDMDEDEEVQYESTRRESTVEMSWEQKEMQRHAEKMQQERRADHVRETTSSPWWRPEALAAFRDPVDPELKLMQENARPPMLGDDIVFPRCPSPEPARFDPTQAPMSRVPSRVPHTPDDEDGLWQVPPSPPLTRVTSVKSIVSTVVSPTESKGLWGGFCTGDGRPGTAGGGLFSARPTGLLTPQHDGTNPFEQAFSMPADNVSLHVPTKCTLTIQTPAITSSAAALDHVNNLLISERELDAHMASEFPDPFITQIYNYLSLGYPSLARHFDEELAKISRVPISELRKDDAKAKVSTRGYIRFGPDFEAGDDHLDPEGFTRWHALKLYVREWARQEKNQMMGADCELGNWGTAAVRRGSWAI